MNIHKIECPHCGLETSIKAEKKIAEINEKERINLIIVSYSCCHRIIHVKEVPSEVEASLSVSYL